MDKQNQFVVFTLDEQRFGLELTAVERVVRRVEITPLPKAPEIVLGVVNVRGRVIPVVDIRRRFRLPERRPALSDQIIIARTAQRAVALAVDATIEVLDRPQEDMIEALRVLPGIEYVEGVLKLEDGLILIHDLNRFLSLEEEAALDRAAESA